MVAVADETVRATEEAATPHLTPLLVGELQKLRQTIRRALLGTTDDIDDHQTQAEEDVFARALAQQVQVERLARGLDSARSTTHKRVAPLRDPLQTVRDLNAWLSQQEAAHSGTGGTGAHNDDDGGAKILPEDIPPGLKSFAADRLQARCATAAGSERDPQQHPVASTLHQKHQRNAQPGAPDPSYEGATRSPYTLMGDVLVVRGGATSFGHLYLPSPSATGDAHWAGGVVVCKT